LIAEEHQYQTQIDRACAAQSQEMMPKEKTTPVDKDAHLEQIDAKINSYFKD